MAEVGLLPFARIALGVSRAVLPRYRSRFSKRQFTQPQLLAILCLMRYEDWTFREAEVRLSEHRELRQVLGLASAPDFTTLYRCLAASRRPDHRPRHWRNGASVAWFAAPGAEAGARRRGCHRLGPRRGEHLLCAAHASSRTKTTALEALAEVGGGRGFGSAIRVVAARATRPLERLRELACRGRSSFRANAHRVGTGRRRVRQREKSYLYPQATRSAERHSRQAR